MKKIIYLLTSILLLSSCGSNSSKHSSDKTSSIESSDKTSSIELSELKTLMTESHDDFIIIMAEPSCSNCQHLDELLISYQKNIKSIESLYHFDITDLINDLNDKDETTHDDALFNLKFITDKIVDTYLGQQTIFDASWPKLSSDSTRPWFQEQNFISRPTTLFYKDGVLWSVVLGTWTNSVTDYSKCDEIITAWENDDYPTFAKIFNYE